MDRIQNLTANPLKIQPAVNQVELNFWNPQPELLKVCIRYHFIYAVHVISDVVPSIQ